MGNKAFTRSIGLVRKAGQRHKTAKRLDVIMKLGWLGVTRKLLTNLVRWV